LTPSRPDNVTAGNEFDVGHHRWFGLAAGLSAVRSTAPHAVNAASKVAFTSVSSIGPMGGSAARSSSGPVT
jgi:hypothetical protein